MTLTQYINSERVKWGDEYVDSLIERGYAPVNTTAGWKWIVVPDSDYASVIERGMAIRA